MHWKRQHPWFCVLATFLISWIGRTVGPDPSFLSCYASVYFYQLPPLKQFGLDDEMQYVWDFSPTVELFGLC